MAIYHCSIKVGSRSKGQSAVAAAAYRAGEKLTDHETGLVSDYTKKSGVVYSEIALCENAPAEYADRQTLWSAVHQIEKAKDARLWREIEVALPKEFSRSDQIETVRDFVKRLTDQGMCADWSLHDKGDGNPHAHIMLTTRSIKPDGTWAPKSRKVYDLDENGEKIGSWISSDWHAIFQQSFTLKRAIVPILQLFLPVIFLIAVGIWTTLDFEERKWVLFADKVSIIVIWSGIGISFVFGKQLSAIGLNTVMLPIAVYLLYVLARWLFETGAIDGLANLVARLTDWWHDLEPNEKQGNALLAVIFIIAAIMVYRWIA